MFVSQKYVFDKIYSISLINFLFWYPEEIIQLLIMLMSLQIDVGFMAETLSLVSKENEVLKPSCRLFLFGKSWFWVKRTFLSLLYVDLGKKNSK